MNRSHPQGPFLSRYTGEKQSLLAALYGGIRESRLESVYPYLNFDELVAFASGSWKKRETQYDLFCSIVEHDTINEVFKSAFAKGFPWINAYKKLNFEDRKKLEKLNPYESSSFQDRLAAIPLEELESLRESLAKPVKKYVFECQYKDEKRRQRGDNSNLEIMMFQAVYPRRGKIVPAYSKEICRIFRKRFPKKVKLENRIN